MQVQRNKAIVGRNAFAHEAGIHQDGMLKERTTYEIMRPEDVGFAKTDLVLGKHSGRAALADRAKALGYHLTGEQLNTVFEQFKVLADKKKEIYDADIAALIEQQIHAVDRSAGRSSRYHADLRHRRTCPRWCSRSGAATRQITRELTARRRPDRRHLPGHRADSPASTVVCKDFRVHSVTVGKDAQGEVTVEVEYRGQIYRGRGVSTDSVEASAKAFLNAINRIAATDGKSPAKVSPYERAD